MPATHERNGGRPRRASSASRKPTSNGALWIRTSAPHEEAEHPIDHVAEARLGLQALARQAVHRERAGIDIALGIQVQVQRAPGEPAVDDFDAADLDDPVPILGGQAGRLGVENDLAPAHDAPGLRDSASPAGAADAACSGSR